MADRSIERLAERAKTLAGAWGARARASTTLGQERAILRLFGVTGLDRSGRPLAGAAVDRWLVSARDGLGGGIALPFTVALSEYDLDPQQLALDVASGAIDLALEAELLRERDRREAAVADARRMVDAAMERIDADRVARRELVDLLGEAPRPWIGTTLAEPEVDGALDEAAALASAGYDLLRVEVPIGRELADRMQSAGVEPPVWRPGDRERDRSGMRRRDDIDEDQAPSGSQRALARLRRAADGVAAQRRGYVRLGTAIPPLGVPEGAVVAAFERVDLVEADPIAEIVVGGVDPDRSLADHAFARRFQRRADTFISIGPGPLVVAPDLVSGVPSDPATRSGRALALQLLGVELARGDRIPAERIVVGAYPAWLADEPSAVARILAEVDVRRALFPDQIIRFDEPVEVGARTSAAWPYIVANALARTGPSALLMRARRADMTTAVADARAAARTASDVASVSQRRALHGVARDHGTQMLAAAMTTLDRLTDLGWRAMVGDPPRSAARGRDGAAWAIGGDAVAERTEGFDVLALFDEA